MAPRERRGEPSTIQQFPKGSSKKSEARKDEKQKKKEEKAAKKEALAKQKTKDEKVKQKDEARKAGKEGLLARIFKRDKVEEGTPTDPDWIPADETKGPGKNKGKLSSFFEARAQAKEEKKAAKEAKDAAKDENDAPVEEASEDPAETPADETPDEGRAPYEAVLAEKTPDAWARLESKRRVCLGIVDKSTAPPPPDDVPWAFEKAWKVRLLLMTERPHVGPWDALGAPGFEREAPDGATLTVLSTSGEPLSKARPFARRVELHCDPAHTKVSFEVKAGDEQWSGDVTLPDSKGTVKHAAVILLEGGRPLDT